MLELLVAALSGGTLVEELFLPPCVFRIFFNSTRLTFLMARWLVAGEGWRVGGHGSERLLLFTVCQYRPQ